MGWGGKLGAVYLDIGSNKVSEAFEGCLKVVISKDKQKLRLEGVSRRAEEQNQILLENRSKEQQIRCVKTPDVLRPA